MIEPDADREALRERLVWMLDGPLVDSRGVRHYDVADAILDANDLLVVDLRCPTCEGEVTVYEGIGPLLDPCPTRHGSARRDVRVVDTDLLRVVARAALIHWREPVNVAGSEYQIIETMDPEKRAEIEGWAK